jgi:prepilin-type N-terminal cleavage/methylation domain-containing protein
MTIFSIMKFKNEVRFSAGAAGFASEKCFYPRTINWQLRFAKRAEFRYKADMKPSQRTTTAREGFSLIELLCVLALILAMTFMMFGFDSASHQRSQKKLCADNLQKIYLAMQIYANDFKGALPQNTNAVTSEDALDALVPHYTADTTIFTCPGGRDKEIASGESLRNHRISYAYFMGRRLDTPQNFLMADRLMDTLPKRKGDFVFSTNGIARGNNHHKYGGNFLLCDGSVQDSEPELTFPLPATPGVVLLNPKP